MDILLIGLFVLLISLVLIFYGLKRKKNYRQKKSVGLQWLVLMRQLVANLQRHRGLVNAFLNGDHSTSANIEALQVNIDHYVKKIEDVDFDILQNCEWVSIKEHWYRLSQQYANLGLQNSLDQHSKIISNTLYLIEEIADECHLLELKGIERYGYDFVWKDLLESIEYMGQLRALGTGVAACGQCSSVQRIRLNYLKDKVSLVVGRLERYVEQNPDEKAAVNNFIKTVEAEILKKEKLSVSSKDYFELASRAIDAIYGEYDRILENVSVA